MKILVVTNQKGGVGKTTIALHLAWAAKEQGRRVLLVDLDHQGNASQTLTGDREINLRRGGSSVLFSPGKPIKPMETPGDIALLHGHQYLDAAGSAIDAGIDRHAAIRALPFDVVVVDTPPSVSALLSVPQYWADRLILPLTPDPYAVDGVRNTQTLIARARTENPSLAERVVINIFTRHVRAARQSLTELERSFDLKQPYLHASQSVKKAVAAGVPVWNLRHPDCSNKLRPAPQEIRGQWQILCRGLLDD